MMRRNTPGLIPEGGVIGKLPFDGQWLTERSPTRRVPSHGTHLFATTYAFDFVSVDDDGLTAPARSMRALFTPEPPELFYTFGRPLYSPVAGTVVSVHDGEPDHVARRSVLTRIPYGLSQPQRIRQGLPAIPETTSSSRLPRGLIAWDSCTFSEAPSRCRPATG